jgi:hypothetical protein
MSNVSKLKVRSRKCCLTKSVVMPLVLRNLPRAEILRRHHASSGQDTQQFVEKWILWSHCSIKRHSQCFRGAGKGKEWLAGEEGKGDLISRWTPTALAAETKGRNCSWDGG